MTEPFSPDDALRLHASGIPNAVFDVFNQLLSDRFSARHHSVYISQPEVVALLVEKGLDRAEIFQKGWLDIEPHYTKAGWRVEYDKPGYCESYDAHWTFYRRKP